MNCFCCDVGLVPDLLFMSRILCQSMEIFSQNNNALANNFVLFSTYHFILVRRESEHIVETDLTKVITLEPHPHN